MWPTRAPSPRCLRCWFRLLADLNLPATPYGRIDLRGHIFGARFWLARSMVSSISLGSAPVHEWPLAVTLGDGHRRPGPGPRSSAPQRVHNSPTAFRKASRPSAAALIAGKRERFADRRLLASMAAGGEFGQDLAGAHVRRISGRVPSERLRDLIVLGGGYRQPGLRRRRRSSDTRCPSDTQYSLDAGLLPEIRAPIS